MIRKKEQKKEIVIDLTGPEGNVFVLMGYAKRFSQMLQELWEDEMLDNRAQNVVLKHLGLEKGDLLPESLGDQVVGEMMSGDYEHAVQVFDRYFGSFVILER